MTYTNERIKRNLPVHCQKDFDDIILEKNNLKKKASLSSKVAIVSLSLLCASSYFGFNSIMELNNKIDDFENQIHLSNDHISRLKNVHKELKKEKRLSNALAYCKIRDLTCKTLSPSEKRKYIEYGYLEHKTSEDGMCHVLWHKNDNVSSEECESFFSSKDIPVKKPFLQYYLRHPQNYIELVGSDGITYEDYWHKEKGDKKIKKEAPVVKKETPVVKTNVCEKNKNKCKIYNLKENKAWCKMYIGEKTQKCLITFSEYPETIYEFYYAGKNLTFGSGYPKARTKFSDSYFYSSIKDIK